MFGHFIFSGAASVRMSRWKNQRKGNGITIEISGVLNEQVLLEVEDLNDIRMLGFAEEMIVDIRPEKFAQSLKFIMFLGAAFYDLNTWGCVEERKELGRRVEGLLPAFRVTGEEGPIRDCIQRMMDKVQTERVRRMMAPELRKDVESSWVPTGEYGKFLERLNDSVEG